MLSLYPFYKVKIASFHNEENFEFTITREKFEELAKNIFEKMMALLKQILEESKYRADDIDEVILVGGSCRIPKVQELLSTIFQRR